MECCEVLAPVGCIESLGSGRIIAWHKEDGIIYFSVAYDGVTGKNLIKHLQDDGVSIGNYAKQVLHSLDLGSTSIVGKTTTKIAVLPGKLFTDNHRTKNKICAEAKRRGFIEPPAELTCLVSDCLFSEDIQAMGLSCVVVMHEPIVGHDGDQVLLVVDGFNNSRSIHACKSTHKWNPSVGFAFIVPEQQETEN
ncbi:MAG: hypothetical protein RIQ54_19 [Candidatus Parcubacteria bacterium]|jgi:hypothetical protein